MDCVDNHRHRHHHLEAIHRTISAVCKVNSMDSNYPQQIQGPHILCECRQPVCIIVNGAVALSLVRTTVHHGWLHRITLASLLLSCSLLIVCLFFSLSLFLFVSLNREKTIPTLAQMVLINYFTNYHLSVGTM